MDGATEQGREGEEDGEAGGGGTEIETRTRRSKERREVSEQSTSRIISVARGHYQVKHGFTDKQ